MRYACLIITYSSAQQTKRIISKLNNGDFDFYIHLDKKIPIESHVDLFDIPNVYFIDNRIRVNWAGFSIVQAIFSGIKQIIKSGIVYDFINLMSGQDYPIKSADYISQFLSKHTGKQLINTLSFKQWTEANARIDRYHLTDIIFKGKYFIERMFNKINGKRNSPQWLTFYGSNSTFWSLTPKCAMYVVEAVESNTKLFNFFKYTWGSDEFVFQTMIMNSHLASTVINNNFRYVDWSNGGSHPKLLTSEDFKKIQKSDAIFARKFDIKKDARILDMIDLVNRQQ